MAGSRLNSVGGGGLVALDLSLSTSDLPLEWASSALRLCDVRHGLRWASVAKILLAALSATGRTSAETERRRPTRRREVGKELGTTFWEWGCPDG